MQSLAFHITWRAAQRCSCNDVKRPATTGSSPKDADAVAVLEGTQRAECTAHLIVHHRQPQAIILLRRKRCTRPRSAGTFFVSESHACFAGSRVQRGDELVLD
jgi:hypothetical protein